ncbi:sigma-54-dependent transcriptional regulator [Virgibacillus sp. L01]|uniref:sigma-54-dependent transcriptional regulator n=1 Tax=Virgibacillus sp. L01 TaxID=3457429 RepID=UPI003FCFDC7B
MNNILFVDDEIKLLKILSSSFKKKNYVIYTASNGEEARDKLEENPIDIVFLDLRLPDTMGLELLEEFSSTYPDKAIIIMTAYGDIESAVSAMKAGAFDYISKPAKIKEIEVVIQKAQKWIDIKRENEDLKSELKEISSRSGFIGSSPEMKQILQIIERVSDTNATVLLQGESGTGKSMVARMIYKVSGRNKAPFLTINCAALPENLLESELFGFEKGAFTGANTSKKGKFEAADEGTIFLDEIGEVPFTLQAKLLQVIQDKTFMRIGSNETKQVDVRIIAATNRDLKEMVEEGTFREDLYYRLKIVDIYIPPIREHIEDVELLADRFLDKYKKIHSKECQLTESFIKALMNYEWPGNVRELENAIERAVVLSKGTELSTDDLPQELQKSKSALSDVTEGTKTLPEHLNEVEEQVILSTLEKSNGNRAEAAKLLGISRQLLSYKMNKSATFDN